MPIGQNPHEMDTLDKYYLTINTACMLNPIDKILSYIYMCG